VVPTVLLELTDDPDVEKSQCHASHAWHEEAARFETTTVKAVVGSLIMVFAFLEMSSRFQALALSARRLSLGRALSGFFGGLSGNQGALRSAFLLKAALTKDAFIATGIVSAVIVDIVRLTVYGTGFLADHLATSQDMIVPVAVASVSAFVGAYFGRRMLRKVTFRSVRLVVAVAMLLIGLGLVAGLV
jgi:uncharacterized membrane protein YfcA